LIASLPPSPIATSNPGAEGYHVVAMTGKYDVVVVFAQEHIVAGDAGIGVIVALDPVVAAPPK